jgi:hypothetical protein
LLDGEPVQATEDVKSFQERLFFGMSGKMQIQVGFVWRECELARHANRQPSGFYWMVSAS